MFSHKEVFTETFLPQDLPGRDEELRTLRTHLTHTRLNEPAESVWQLGPSGVGKTTTARYLLNQFRTNYVIDWTRVECVGSTRWELLDQICSAHPKIVNHSGMGTDELIEKLEANVNSPFVIILDEFDGLEDPELLADLSRIEPISLICIGHDYEQALATVPDGVDDLRDAPTIEFDPYAVDALLEILEARVETGLERGVVDDDQLERIASGASGSARRAVQSLRSAVELGEERGHTSVEPEDVDDCFAHAKERIREQLLDSLSREHHIVYQVIRDAGQEGILPSEIVERYQDRSSDPRGTQQVRTYREKLERYDLVESEGSSRWDRWFVVDETLKAPLRETAAL